MREDVLDLAGCRLEYRLEEGKVFITGYHGTASGVEVPSEIEGYPVVGIARKTFLSHKNLRRIVLPDTLEEVGDWAFAHCDGLVTVELPGKRVRFGRAVFKECGRLRRIEIRVDVAKGQEESAAAAEGVPELLAAAVWVMDAYYLLDLQEAGSGEWLGKWDARLLTILRASDQEGYSKQVLCGEEDYGSTDLGAFSSGRRKEKVRLAFLRLLYPLRLSGTCREELEEYLRCHTKGQPGEETWLVLKEEHGNDRKYYELFAELSCINEDNYDEILTDMGEGCPEMKAYFMRLREGQTCVEDFFAGLAL